MAFGNMNSAQRSAAARKAAATRRAKRQARAYAGATSGTYSSPPPPRSTYTPPVTPRPAAPIYSAPVKTSRGLKLAALAALEDVFVQQCKESGVTDDARKAFAQYQKLKALAIGHTSNSAMQNEADTALRMATINLVKVTF